MGEEELHERTGHGDTIEDRDKETPGIREEGKKKREDCRG